MQLGRKNLFSQRVADVAGEAVSTKGYVSMIDLMLGLNWLAPNKLRDWKQGKIPYLERIISANLSKISKTMKEFKHWAVHSNLKPSITVYKHKSHKLRFSKTGEPNIETAYSTHYVLLKSEKEQIK